MWFIRNLLEWAPAIETSPHAIYFIISITSSRSGDVARTRLRATSLPGTRTELCMNTPPGRTLRLVSLYCNVPSRLSRHNLYSHLHVRETLLEHDYEFGQVQAEGNGLYPFAEMNRPVGPCENVQPQRGDSFYGVRRAPIRRKQGTLNPVIATSPHAIHFIISITCSRSVVVAPIRPRLRARAC